MTQTLHADGVSDYFFQLLWCKDELNFGPPINLPDTIVFKFGQPIHWYFTGVDGKLKKKNKHNLVNVRIEEALTRHIVGCDIVAYYISTEDSDDPSSKTCIEYLDRKALHDFLYKPFKEHSGILQRFIEPKGTQNSMVRAIWSPKVCLLERRQNNKPLHDSRYGLYERAVTYDGPDHFSSAAPLRGSVLPSNVQRICENVVSHIAEVSFQKQCVSRMVLNFKLDAKDRIWLLWSSSIRLSGQSEIPTHHHGHHTKPNAPLNIDTIVRLPEHIQLKDKLHHTESGKGQPPQLTCVSCNKSYPVDQYHPVSYKHIIAHFEQVIALMTADSRFNSGTVAWPPDPAIIDTAGGVGFGPLAALIQDVQNATGSDSSKARPPVTDEDVLIPPVIRYHHPKLTAEVYNRYKKDPLFYYKNVKVCENCYLVYAELAMVANLVTVRRLETDSAEPSIDSRPAGMMGRGRTDVNWDEAPGVAPKATKQASRRRRAPGTMTMDSGAGMDGSEGMSLKDSMHDPPSFPGRIRSAEDIPETSEQDVEALIQQREDAFFKEISADQKLRSGHPLTHLIASHNKLENVNKAPNIKRALGVQASAQLPAGASPYSLPQPLVDVGRTKRKKGVGSKQSAQPGSVKDDRTVNTGGMTGGTMSKSAARHREFLMQTLEDIQSQLTTPSALKNFVETHTSGAAYPVVPTDPDAEELPPDYDDQAGPDVIPDREPGMDGDDMDGGFEEGDLILLEQGYHVQGKFVSVRCAEISGPKPLAHFEIIYPLKSMNWTFDIDPEQLGLEPGNWNKMPVEERSELCGHMLDRLRWTTEEDLEFNFG